MPIYKDVTRSDMPNSSHSGFYFRLLFLFVNTACVIPISN